jgi:hypothetical protein
MKKFLLLILACSASNALFAQFITGDLKPDDLETFRKSTTVFVLRRSDEPLRQDFERSISEIWTVTPFKVITTDSQRFFQGKKYSLFRISAGVNHHQRTANPNWDQRQANESILDYKTVSFSYELSIPDFNKKGEPDGRTLIAQFCLYGDFATVKEMIAPTTAERLGVSAFESRKVKEERERKMLDRLYNETRYYNWGPGQIRGYLKSVNDQLINGKRRTMLAPAIQDKEQLKALATDTLYLPNYLKNKVNPYLRTESKADDEDADEDVAKAYPFPHRYIDEAELEQMIVHSSKPIYHLVYVRTVSAKHIAVVEAKSATIIYSVLQQMSYNFKMKDLKKLAEHI